MIFDALGFVIALGIVGVIIGGFLYKTYQVLFKKPINTSPWKRVPGNVLTSHVIENFLHGEKGVEISFEYSINGRRYTGTGTTTLYAQEQPPSTVELVYKAESPEAWEWAEDHSEMNGTASETRFAILFIWLLLIMIGTGVIIAVYFPELLIK